MRLKLTAPLRSGDFAASVPTAAEGARAVGAGDAGRLARLMLAAYRGTTDDEGETLADAEAEVARLLAGSYGAFDFDTSELTEREGEAIAATLVTMFEGAPLIAFSMTAPSWKRRGLARGGLARAMARLRARGHDRVHLVVTSGNEPAERLYRSMGFAEA